MNNVDAVKNFFSEGYKDFRPSLTVDCAIFGYSNDALKILLIKNSIVTKWCLPGGFVKRDESLDTSAARVTLERTGLDSLFLKQFKTFADPKRNDPKGAFDAAKFLELTGITLDADNWLISDTTSVGFYAITDIVNAQPKPDLFSTECAWFSVNDLPDLAFDHAEMVREALATMRIELYHFPIGKNLLQPKFTLKEVKTLYEVLSGKTLNPTNFPNKLIALNLLTKLNEKRSIGGHRSPTYYKFNDSVYNTALEEGIALI